MIIIITELSPRALINNSRCWEQPCVPLVVSHVTPCSGFEAVKNKIHFPYKMVTVVCSHLAKSSVATPFIFLYLLTYFRLFAPPGA